MSSNINIVGRQITLRDWTKEDIPTYSDFQKPGHGWLKQASRRDDRKLLELPHF
jgi:hypothetical protein